MQKKKIKNYIAREDGLERSKLFLYGDVADCFDDDISARSVQKELAQLGGKDVEVHINSYGGDLFEGIAIYNLLKNYSGRVTTVIDGVAASAASVIAMAADEVFMPKNTQMLIHNPWTFAYGNASELRKVADDLEKAQTSLEECYVGRFKGTREKLQALLAEDKFLTADEAQGFGLCTVIDDAKPSEDEAMLVDRVAARVVAMIQEHKVVEAPPVSTVETPEKSQNTILKLFAKEKR